HAAPRSSSANWSVSHGIVQKSRSSSTHPSNRSSQSASNEARSVFITVRCCQTCPARRRKFARAPSNARPDVPADGPELRLDIGSVDAVVADQHALDRLFQHLRSRPRWPGDEVEL